MLRPIADPFSPLKGLTHSQAALLEPHLEPCSYQCDAVIFEQGDPAQYLYMLIQGEVQVRYKAYDGPVISVAHVGSGGVFGWSAALGRIAYTSGAVCLSDCLLYRITGKALHQVCDAQPETGIVILEKLANSIAERLSSTHGQVLDMLTHSPYSNGECLRRLSQHDNR